MGARFFCENCGAEVKRDSKTCPHCGRSFANVLCPACGFSGEARLFAVGCPVCGHTAPSPMGVAPRPSDGPSLPVAGPVNAASKPGRGNGAFPRFAAGAPPAWAYLLAALALAGVFALLLTK
ncbi:MAG: zinc ribbon domain-containing protein [Treponema sp.]|nr:zinc ribbon domain-containing protein [Treponema sp.]